MCQRVHDKARVLKAINLGSPEERILAIIDLLKAKLSRLKYGKNGHFTVPLTRQDIADMTGLRVETVIRKVRLLEGQGFPQIEDRKILRAYGLDRKRDYMSHITPASPPRPRHCLQTAANPRIIVQAAFPANPAAF
ncbi:MAG: helix-turn-helix domain-containing protein [Lewinellaceae bacterium]|nr:helix-turn-helix domain-containing protein [Lewinellaceae bacterium]